MCQEKATLLNHGMRGKHLCLYIQISVRLRDLRFQIFPNIFFFHRTQGNIFKASKCLMLGDELTVAFGKNIYYIIYQFDSNNFVLILQIWRVNICYVKLKSCHCISFLQALNDIEQSRFLISLFPFFSLLFSCCLNFISELEISMNSETQCFIIQYKI